ncbi:AAA family ATPase [Streptomyces sp. RPA4-5]|uniref:ATP-binding protein n=1 Tax=Streptomyces sp. RPA4-5 TaxID=2721245 RepID=UPI00143E5718|nr:AAA family ATPase [Streptomyces sp. RPA4-5]QIY54430.1 AAA family ATPase [Streptomyces sp. RPA4-5]
MEARISGLVGREAETAEVRRLVETAVAGAGQSAFIVGEAGLGKTSVLEEGMGTARRLGMRALSGAAQDRERQLPFAAIAGCLGADAASSDGLRSRVAEIVQGHERRGIPGALGGGGEADFAGMEALLGLVEDLCAREPLALFFDNLQLADPASLEVVRRLMRSVHQLPLLLVGAYRPDHLCEVDRLVRGAALGRHTVLELAPLSPSAASALLAEQCGGAPGPRLWSMAQGAAGNPLYLTELAAALLREKAIEVHDGAADPVPPLKTLITRRWRHLRDDVLQALRVAAVLGADCTVTDLAAVLDRPAHEVLSIVSEAAGAGILCEVGSHLVFRHALVRHALYEALPGSTRAMLHFRAAQVLAGTGATPERVAGHLLAEAPETGGFLTSWLMESAAALTSRAPPWSSS